MLKGMTLEEAKEIKNTQIVEGLSLPPVKIHCSVLAESSIKAAISDYQSKDRTVNGHILDDTKGNYHQIK